MQVTCPRCRALADRTYERPLLRRTKCRYCGYELEEVNVKEAAKIIDLMEKEKEREIDEQTERDVEFLRQKHREYQEKWLEDHAGICTPMWCRPIPKEKIPLEGYWRVPGDTPGMAADPGGEGHRCCREEGQEDRAVQSVERDCLAPLAEGRDMREGASPRLEGRRREKRIIQYSIRVSRNPQSSDISEQFPI